MKKHSYLTIILFLFGCSKRNYISSGLIVFGHTGMTTMYIKPLYISTHEVKITLSDGEISDLKGITRRDQITELDKAHYITLYYDIVTTDTITFLAIDKFILDHKKYYVDKRQEDTSPSSGSYAIIINKKISFFINSEFKYLFFSDLGEYLIERHCDEKVIQELSYY